MIDFIVKAAYVTLCTSLVVSAAVLVIAILVAFRREFPLETDSDDQVGTGRLRYIEHDRHAQEARFFVLGRDIALRPGRPILGSAAAMLTEGNEPCDYK